MALVTNKNGYTLDFGAAAVYMDDNLREALAADGYETEQDFFTAYEAAHLTTFGEEWELSKTNPCW